MPTINIMPDELQTQIGKLNTLYNTCQGHKPDDIKQEGDGSSIRAIQLMVGEYTGLQATLATLIYNASNYFQHTLDAMSETDKAAAKQFESSHPVKHSKPKIPAAKPEIPQPKSKIPAAKSGIPQAH